MGYCGIEEQEFMMSQQVHMMNPQFQQTMMQIQMGSDNDSNWKPAITREKTIEVLKFMEEMKMESILKELIQACLAAPLAGKNDKIHSLRF